MNEYEVEWYKQLFVVLIFPVLAILATIEPIWSESVQAWQRAQFNNGLRHNWMKLRSLYLHDLWRKKE